MKHWKWILSVLLAAVVAASGGVYYYLHLPKEQTLPIITPRIAQEQIMKQGEAFYRQRYYAPLIAMYMKMLEKAPDSMDIKKKLALAYFGAGDHAKARALLEEVAKARPDDTEVKELLGKMQ